MGNIASTIIPRRELNEYKIPKMGHISTIMNLPTTTDHHGL